MLFRVIHFYISALVFIYDQVYRSIFIIFRKPFAGTCIYLNYHTVNSSNAHLFKKQMETLKQIALPLRSLSEQKLSNNRYHFIITFDDAFKSFYENAFPILLELKIPVLLFVPTGYMGRKSDWADYGGDNKVGEEVLSEKEMREIIKSGLVQIGSHGVNHKDLVHLSDKEMIEEMLISKQTLERINMKVIDTISFPYGSFHEREVSAAQKAGYKFMFSVTPQRITGKITPGLIGRVSIQPYDSLIEFRLKIYGAYRWLHYASVLKRKLQNRISVPQ